MKEIEDLRHIYVTGADEEERKDNEEKIREWEEGLLHNESLAEWQGHDITKSIIGKAREAYTQCAMQILDRRTSEDHRRQLWAKQDACMWIIQLASGDPKSEIARIENEIRAALKAATN